MSDDFELGSAVIPVRVDDKGVDQGLRQVESKVRQAGSRAESEGIGGGGLMDKYLFGRRGREGVGESMEHVLGHAAFGRAARIFAAGGAMSVGIGELAHLAFDLGREWFNVATGAEAAAKATERAAEANKKAAESMNALVELTQAGANEAKKPKSAESIFDRAVHWPGAVGVAKEALSENQKKIDEQRAREKAANKAAMDAELTESEQQAAREAGTRRRTAEIQSGKRGYYSWEEISAADAEDQFNARRDKKARIREQAGVGTADEMQTQNSFLGRYQSGMILGGRAGSSFLGNILPGMEQFGRGALSGINAFSGSRVTGRDPIGLEHGEGIGGDYWRIKGGRVQIDSTHGGALGRMFGAAGGIGGQIGEGGRVSTEAAQHIADLRRDFARRKAAYDEEQQFSGGGRSSDIANRGAQIQGAILEPSPWEREGRELNRKIHDINEDMLKALQELNPLTKLKDVIANMNAGFK